jgi:DNA-binding transcriptional MerR regulator
MINPSTRSTFIPESARTSQSREIQLFEPPADAVYTIEATSRMVDVPRRTILVYCKHHLLSPAIDADHGYYFDGDAIRALRRIELLRAVCDDDLAAIKMILDLTAALERLRSDIRLLSRAKSSSWWEKSDGKAPTVSSRRINVKSNSRKKRK